ncbi:hypothetical protein H702_07145 [Streptococcus equinus JB1]|uniref:Uncharacterized protein n=1 Tax=Streptococcus equinus JB1 TaxID=1294274 RepID=A0A091BRU9_STREI|nr:hypothetical protein H702_07145 [Streptococcus equinus JB1]
MTSFESTIINFILHFFLFVFMFIMFCGAVFLLILAITTVWYFIEEGCKNLKEWRTK